MSKTKNEERREIVNKRLAEIIDKDVIPKKERVEEPISHEIPESHNHSSKSPSKIRTYLIRIGIIVVLFFVLKSLDFGKLIDSSLEVSKKKEEVKVEAKVTVPAKDVKNLYGVGPADLIAINEKGAVEIYPFCKSLVQTCFSISSALTNGISNTNTAKKSNGRFIKHASG